MCALSAASPQSSTIASLPIACICARWSRSGMTLSTVRNWSLPHHLATDTLRRLDLDLSQPWWQSRTMVDCVSFTHRSLVLVKYHCQSTSEVWKRLLSMFTVLNGMHWSLSYTIQGPPCDQVLWWPRRCPWACVHICVSSHRAYYLTMSTYI